MTDIPRLIAANAARWPQCVILKKRAAEVAALARRLVAAKSRYQKISTSTGVPWFDIAVIHQREASQDFACSIAQGDPWNDISTHVPRGRGPFASFEDAAIDALVKCAPFAARWRDWSAGGTLTLFELYNGPGYENFHHEASPYNWAATNLEMWGKYTSDGHWSAQVWDTQIGCAAMLKAMMVADPTIEFSSEVKT
jgi:lysozyme family protein